MSAQPDLSSGARRLRWSISPHRKWHCFSSDACMTESKFGLVFEKTGGHRGPKKQLCRGKQQPCSESALLWSDVTSSCPQTWADIYLKKQQLINYRLNAGSFKSSEIQIQMQNIQVAIVKISKQKSDVGCWNIFRIMTHTCTFAWGTRRSRTSFFVDNHAKNSSQIHFSTSPAVLCMCVAVPCTRHIVQRSVRCCQQSLRRVDKFLSQVYSPIFHSSLKGVRLVWILWGGTD